MIVPATLGRSKAVGLLDATIVAIIFRSLGSEGLSIISIRRRAERSGASMIRDRGYTERDLAEVSDNPEWTDEELAEAVPFAIAFPDLAESLKSGIKMVRIDGDAPVEIVLEDDVAAYYRSFGDNAKTRLNADLRKIAGLPERA